MDKKGNDPNPYATRIYVIPLFGHILNGGTSYKGA